MINGKWITEFYKSIIPIVKHIKWKIDKWRMDIGQGDDREMGNREGWFLLIQPKQN